MQNVHEQMQGSEGERIGQSEDRQETTMDGRIDSPVPELVFRWSWDALQLLIPKAVVQVDNDRQVYGKVVAAPLPVSRSRHRRQVPSF